MSARNILPRRCRPHARHLRRPRHIDANRLAIGKQTPDLPFGSGVSDIKGVLDEFKAMGFTGNISIEYETKWENNLPDVAQCVGFFRGYGSSR